MPMVRPAIAGKGQPRSVGRIVMVTVDDDVGPVVEAVGRLNVFAQAFEPAVDTLSGIRTSVDVVAEKRDAI